MNEQQMKTIRTRVSVKLQIALEGLLNAIAKDDMFADVPSEDIVNRIVADMANPELLLDMVAWLDSVREVSP